MRIFNQINIVPRWIIFSLDLFICIFSFCFAYFLRFNFSISQINQIELSRNILIFSLLSSIVFFSIKTYAGIIRYTSAQDSFRILFAIVLSNGLFFVTNLVLISLGKPQIISNIILVINGLSAFLLLITYRVLVKYFFIYIKNLKIDRRAVIIYGAGETGIALKRTLDHDPNVNMRVIAFLDDDERKSQKKIDGVEIYHSSEFEDFINNY